MYRPIYHHKSIQQRGSISQIFESEGAVLDDILVAMIIVYSKVEIGATLDQPSLGGTRFLAAGGRGCTAESSRWSGGRFGSRAGKAIVDFNTV
jgi:hypothetical protein